MKNFLSKVVFGLIVCIGFAMTMGAGVSSVFAHENDDFQQQGAVISQGGQQKGGQQKGGQQKGGQQKGGQQKGGQQKGGQQKGGQQKGGQAK